jgi:hypothetical protein
MSPETMSFVLVLAGTIILLLLTVLGFFLARIVTDVRKNTSEIGKNKGRIELVEQQQINDTKRLEEMTQLELKIMSGKVGELSDSVNMFVNALAKKGLESDE